MVVWSESYSSGGEKTFTSIHSGSWMPASLIGEGNPHHLVQDATESLDDSKGSRK